MKPAIRNPQLATRVPHSTELSIRTREENLARMEGEPFDLLVIGGGITGAGVALDAASRGLSVALVDKCDFASGTSSRSTKLIHGGLRYLKQLHFGLVREALRERALLFNLAPHLCKPAPFLVPVYSQHGRSPLGNSRLKLGLGLWLYDLLSGRHNARSHRWVNADGALEMAPLLSPHGLRGGFVYYDCITNDSRLVIEVIRAAANHGAVVANYASVIELLETSGRITGAVVRDALTDRQLTIRASRTINASGVWSDEVRSLGGSAGKRLRPSKGIHVVVPAERLGNRAAVLIPSIQGDRFLFAIPWCGRTIIGTTDADYAGDLDEPVAEAREIREVIESVARSFPDSSLTVKDIISTFAGLRPLARGKGASTSDVSRKEEIIESESGLISIVGGKLTTYRRMAERVVDLAVRRLREAGRNLPPSANRSATETIELPGAGALPSKPEALALEYGVGPETVAHLMRTYGAECRKVLEITRESEQFKRPMTDELPHIEAEAAYSMRFEMAVTVDDVLSRRTRISLLARLEGDSCARRVAALMASEDRSH